MDKMNIDCGVMFLCKAVEILEKLKNNRTPYNVVVNRNTIKHHPRDLC